VKVLSCSEINEVARIGMSCCGVVGLEWSHKPHDSGKARQGMGGFRESPLPQTHPATGLGMTIGPVVSICFEIWGVSSPFF